MLRDIENNAYRIKFSNNQQIDMQNEKELKKYNCQYGEDLVREANRYKNNILSDVN